MGLWKRAKWCEHQQQPRSFPHCVCNKSSSTMEILHLAVLAAAEHQFLEMKSEHGLELHHLPRNQRSLCNGTGPLGSNQGQQEPFWCDEEGEVSRAIPTPVIIQLAQLGGSHSHQETPEENSVLQKPMWQNLATCFGFLCFFKVKEALNLERMTRHAVYSTGPGFGAINLFQLLPQAPSLNFSTSLLSQCPP